MTHGLPFLSGRAQFLSRHLRIFVNGGAGFVPSSIIAKGVIQMKRILTGDALEQRAIQLGVDIQGDLIFQSASGRHRRASDYELQRRVLEAERSIRESKLWKLALISAIASVASAAAAFLAVISKLK